MTKDSKSVLLTSTLISTCPGITLIIFGLTFSQPTVPTFSSDIPVVVTIFSTAKTNSAAATKASLLSAIGVPPA